MKLDQWRRTQAEARGVSLGESGAQNTVEKKLRFKIRAGGGEGDLANAVTKVEPFAALSGNSEQPLQTAAKICSLADIGLAVASQREDSRIRGNFFKKTVTALRRKCDCARERGGIRI